MVTIRVLKDLSLKVKTSKNQGREVEKVARETKGQGDPMGVDIRVRSS